MIFLIALLLAAPTRLQLVLEAAPEVAADFLLQDFIHEGSHCAAAAMTDVGCWSMRPWPQRFQGQLVFGATDWGPAQGKTGATILLAPKAVDLAMLGGYAATLGLGALPENKHARLALTIAALGAEIDFLHPLVLPNDNDDLHQTYAVLNYTRAQSTRFKIGYAVLGLAGLVPTLLGFYSVFR